MLLLLRIFAAAAARLARCALEELTPRQSLVS
jgi:hypothetical protein